MDNPVNISIKRLSQISDSLVPDATATSNEADSYAIFERILTILTDPYKTQPKKDISTNGEGGPEALTRYALSKFALASTSISC